MDIKLKDFEGPLDLLLHLVSKYQMDIYDVPIVEVIEQYLAYIETLQAMRLEVAGEYMVMASQLMLIKSRKLLPKIVETVEEESDPELDLLNQIEEYSRFKELSQQLALKHNERAAHYSKEKQELLTDEVVLLEDKTAMDLFLVFSQVMKRQQIKEQTSQAVIEKEDYKIEDMMVVITDRLRSVSQLVFQELLESCRSHSEMVSHFLALLELIKEHRVSVEQETIFATIYIKKGELWTT